MVGYGFTEIADFFNEIADFFNELLNWYKKKAGREACQHINNVKIRSNSDYSETSIFAPTVIVSAMVPFATIAFSTIAEMKTRSSGV